MDTGEPHSGAPEGAGPRIRKPHPVATASALVAGAVVLVCGGLVAGTLWGPRVLRAWVPTLADDLGVLVEPEAEVERLDDGYGGELARRVAAVSADVVRTALDAPTLDEATAGALQGLVSAADPDGAYLSAAAYGRLAGEDAGAADAEASVDADAAGEGGTDGASDGAGAGDEDAAGGGSDDGTDGAPAGEAADANGPDGADGAGAADGDAEALDGTDTAGASARVTARLAGDVGVLTLSDLGTGAADELAAAVSDLLDQGARGFVLDLRGNPGGSLNEAVAAASLFLDGGTVVQTVDGAGDRSRVFADPDAQLTDAPLAVLVSDGTGSAAEALVAGLQDHARCVTVGQRTAGHGTLQTLKTLSFGGAVAFATASFVTPDGDEVEDVGLAPDVEVAAPAVSDVAAGEGGADGAAEPDGATGADAEAGADGSAAVDAETAGGIDGPAAADAEASDGTDGSAGEGGSGEPAEGDAAADASLDNGAAGEAATDAGAGEEVSADGTVANGASVLDGLASDAAPDTASADEGLAVDAGRLASDEALARALAAVEAWVETGSRAQAIEAARTYTFEPDASATVDASAAEAADGQAPSDVSSTSAAGSATDDGIDASVADGREASDALAGEVSAADGDGAVGSDAGAEGGAQAAVGPDAGLDAIDPTAPAGSDAAADAFSEAPSV